MKRFWTVGLSAALLILGGYYFWNFSSQTPPGQPALVEIDPSSLEAVRAEFNRASDGVRVIALFSPT